MIISPNKIIGSLVYRTREALRNNQNFLDGLSIYDYNPNLFYEGEFSLWHYPGTQNEISNVFISLGENKDGSNLKYPSIFNINPIKQDKNGLNTTLHFNLCIVGPVLSEWLTQEREEQVFIPLLRPIYEEFINQIIKSGYFSLNFGAPAHKMYEVFTTGDSAGVLIERYGDHIDAIEIHGMALGLKNICRNTYKRIEHENNLVTEKV